MSRNLSDHTIKSCPASKVEVGDSVLVQLPPSNMLCVADVTSKSQDFSIRGEFVEIGYRYRNGRLDMSCFTPDTEVLILE